MASGRNSIDNGSRLELLTQEAVEKVPETQPWPYYFKIKAQELRLLFDFLDVGRVERMLEIGCGNAFGSVLFSDKANKIVATDLPNYNLATHTIGLNNAARLIQSLNISNILLLACQAEELPFADESFDLLFSTCVLEHVNNKKEVINEMKRVLKKSGIVIAIVPNFMERLSAPLHFYPYLFKRGIIYFLKLLGFSINNKKNTVVANKEAKQLNLPLPLIKRVKKFSKDYPNFPFCEPHGNYKCWRDEFSSHLPKNWKNLFEYNDLKVIGLYSTMFIPFNFLTLFSEKVAYSTYLKSIPMTKKIGDNPVLKYLGYSLCLVVQK